MHIALSPQARPADHRAGTAWARRQRLFTGRVAELQLLRDSLLGTPPGCQVLWLHGMAGVGKSTLLRLFVAEARESGKAVRFVDMRSTAPTPKGFLSALRAPGGPEDPELLVIDSAELLGPLESWLRDVYLPGLPAERPVLVGARRPPSAEWRTDPQWWDMLHTAVLGPMSDTEAEALLRDRGVPDSSVASLTRAACGLPLALALFAEARQQAETEGTGPIGPLEESPELVGELLRLLLRESPTPDRSDALAVLALARVTTEELIRHTLGVGLAEAHALGNWLRDLSFVRSTAEGLVPHPLVRRTLLADLRWRGLERYERLHRSLHAHLTERLTRRTGGRWALGAGLTHLGSLSRAVREAVDWEGSDRLHLRSARPDDKDAVLRAIGTEHGAAAAATAGAWWERQPSAFSIAEEGGVLAGVLCAPWLEAGATGLPDDPVAEAALTRTRERAPLRRGERILLARWSTGSPAATAFALTTLWAGVPRLAVSWTCVPVRQTGLATLLALYGQRAEAPVSNGQGEVVLLYAQDWRGTGFAAWAGTLCERLLTDDPTALSAPSSDPSQTEMPWPAFAEAVKDAYRNARDPRLLADSPLLATRLVPPGGDAVALRGALVEAVRRLPEYTGQPQLGEILEITYLGERRSQRAAASRARLSFSTYRRRHAEALAKAAELLRERMLYGVGVR
ncbi:ATP-binding protein [Streptomyces sp. Tu6071]|uniref:ATP-binding protein n=1 Tax=Streptomyces sp. Tu6071 TaxID=355249 RepID=UPI0002EB6CD9|nr:ATP-binding protein [Streptomyces sp. Tu6071]